MAFNELGQVQQDFLRPDRRRLLSQKLKQRLLFAGVLNLVFAPVVLAYVVIVYFFTYYNVSNQMLAIEVIKTNLAIGIPKGSQASRGA
jgi:autophagy-related protein 9